jgi:hypothetical protein
VTRQRGSNEPLVLDGPHDGDLHSSRSGQDGFDAACRPLFAVNATTLTPAVPIGLFVVAAGASSVQAQAKSTLAERVSPLASSHAAPDVE